MAPAYYFSALQTSAIGSGNEGPLNTSEFLKRKRHRVESDKLFFHKFFTEKARRDRIKGSMRVSKKRE